MENDDSQSMEEVYGVDAMCCYDCTRILTAPSQVYMEPHPVRYEVPKCSECYSEVLSTALPPSPASDADVPVVRTPIELMVENEEPAEPTMKCFGCGSAMYDDEEGEYRSGFWCSRGCAYGDAHDD
jgi:hypothetical protein